MSSDTLRLSGERKGISESDHNPLASRATLGAGSFSQKLALWR